MFSAWENFSGYIVFELFNFEKQSHIGEALHFFYTIR